MTDVVAVDMARSLGAPEECTGLAVLLQAAMTVGVGRLLFKAFSGSKPDPAAEGVAAGVTAGAMGVAGTAGAQPSALAAGALSYAVMAALSLVVVKVPAVAQLVAQAVV